MRSRRAFTLIELLVVIAIIAILAAILFPVFAQAKVAAKGAASISNDKQVITASMIYQTDFDDKPVLEGQGDADAPILLLGNPYKPWGYLLRPYTKNGEIFQDPLTFKEDPIPGVPADVLWMYRTQYGYAFTIHSPVTYGTAGFVPTGLTQTLLAKPAETVMFILKKGRNNNPDWLWVGSLIWGANLVNPPVLSNNQFETPPGINPYSVISPVMCWGVGCTAYPGQTEEEGGLSGGVAFRKTGKSIVAMADGHVRPYAIGQLAAGTNWTKTRAGWTTTLTDRNRYLWDMD
jgi:prepilin-type N-terminal cleavage/methylation domain-containing protein/prepilin-type processing-associated H-X9-DG protein